jgi:hypothetical protein
MKRFTWKSEVSEFKKLGWSNDAIYNRMTGLAGLYGVAFFGHKLADKNKHRQAKAKLRHIWNLIITN